MNKFRTLELGLIAVAIAVVPGWHGARPSVTARPAPVQCLADGAWMKAHPSYVCGSGTFSGIAP